jgi:hypothetical protein
VARQLAAGSVQFDDMRPLLEFISGQVPYGWLLLSQIYEEVCGEKGLPDAKEAVKRDLEAVPRGVDQVQGWERLTLLCERTHDFEGFVDAEAFLCEVPGVPLNTMSNAAATVLAMLSKPLYRSQPFESRKNVKQMVPRIAAMIASHVDRCSGTDLSRRTNSLPASGLKEAYRWSPIMSMAWPSRNGWAFRLLGLLPALGADEPAPRPF